MASRHPSTRTIADVVDLIDGMREKGGDSEQPVGDAPCGCSIPEISIRPRILAEDVASQGEPPGITEATEPGGIAASSGWRSFGRGPSIDATLAPCATLSGQSPPR